MEGRVLSSTDTEFIGRKVRKKVKEESVEYSAEYIEPEVGRSGFF